MAKKKSPAAATATNVVAGNGTAVSTAPEPAGQQIEQLRALNKLLANQAFENREHVKQLESQISELSEENEFVAGVQAGILGLLASRRIAEIRELVDVKVERSVLGDEEKCRVLEEEVKILKERLGLVCGEKDEVKKSLDLALEERDNVKKLLKMAVEERDEIKRSLELAFKERDTVKKSLDLVSEERDEVKKSLILTVEEREAVKRSLNLAVEERDVVNKSLELVVGERDEVKKSLEMALEERDVVKKSLDLALEERDAVKKTLDLAVEERDEIKKSLGLVVKERDELQRSLTLALEERDDAKKSLCFAVDERNSVIGDLERLKDQFEVHKVAAEKEAGRLKNEKSAVEERARKMDGMMKTVEERLVLADAEKCEVQGALVRVTAEKDMIKSDLEFATAAMLKAQGEVEILQGRVKGLEEEGVALRLEMEKEKDGILKEIEELTGRIRLIDSEKSKISGEKAELENKIVELSEKVAEFEQVVSVKAALEEELEKTKESLLHVESQLESVIHENQDIVEALRLALGLEKQHELIGNNELCELVKDTLSNLKLAHDVLVEEKERLLKVSESEKAESAKEIDDLVNKVTKIEQEKDLLHRLKIEHEGMIDDLKNQIEKLQKEVSQLELLYKASSEKNSQLLADMESAKKDIDDSKKEALQLEWHVSELTKKKNIADEEAQKIKGAYETLLKDHETGKKLCDSLTLEKSSLEKNLKSTQSALKETEQKMITAEKNFRKVLFLLSDTSDTIHCFLDGKEKCIEDDSSREMELDEATLKIDKTVEAVKGHVSKINDLKRELELSKIAVENHKKNNMGAWKWIYPAATSLVAVISLAYATNR